MKVHIIILLLATAALCASAPAAALVYDSTLAGPLGSVAVRAEAAYSAGLWTYTYTADVSQLTRNTTGFSIGNLDRVLFSDAANDRNFTNPVFAGTDSIMWTAGSVAPAAGPIVFTLQSTYSPATVNATLWGGAFPATGTTLGLLPEPSGFAVLAIYGLGAASLFARRRARQ